MTPRYYSGTGRQTQRRRESIVLPASRRHLYEGPEGYTAESQLTDAVNVALALAQPLLLTGEPGTGKTQLAYSLAWELGYGEPLKFETKSVSTARDLFYSYDALARFHAGGGGGSSALPYITFNAFGKAILLANRPDDVRQFLPPGFEHDGPRRSVVLIDEIDKAPRDFPNDLLNELEGTYFRVPELGNVAIGAPKELQPVVVITSNSEKSLPDAFLRRCVYYNIPFPDRKALAGLIEQRLGQFTGGASRFLSGALDLFHGLRDMTVPLRKKPATAELLGWIVAMRDRNADTTEPVLTPELALSTLSVLIKTAEDQAPSRQYVDQWFKTRAGTAG
jgi:MoxR-like ATPase